MKTFRLASIALQAEKVRWRNVAQRMAIKVGLAIFAVIILLFALGAGEVAIYELILDYLPPAGAAGVVAAINLVVAVVLLLIANSKGPSKGEIEARELSASAQLQIRESLKWSNMLSWRTMLIAYDLVRGSRRRR